jgi:hypothetical protein
MFGRRKSRPGRAAAAPERSEEEAPIPAGTFIATGSGKVAHIKSALHPGARCEAMREWTDWRRTGALTLPLCRRCENSLEGNPS